MNLDCTPGGRDRSDDQRRNVTGAERQPPSRSGGPAAAQQGYPAACPSGSAPTAREAEQLGDQAERPHRRGDRRELTRDSSQLVPECLAARAVAHVPACVCVGPDAAIVRFDELLTYHCASGLTRL